MAGVAVLLLVWAWAGMGPAQAWAGSWEDGNRSLEILSGSGSEGAGKTIEEAWVRAQEGAFALSGQPTQEGPGAVVAGEREGGKAPLLASADESRPSGKAEPPDVPPGKNGSKPAKPKGGGNLERFVTALGFAIATAQAGKMAVDVMAYIVGGFVGLATGGISGIPAQARFMGPYGGWIGAVAGFGLGFYFAWAKQKTIRRALQDFLRDRRGKGDPE